ncbi:hypothetical protein K435DRAFT_807251 [Dendrothele bispora CBS 962.96]|uniref:Uncharacterized protein n=1 Tax=Dendrothele bispora (strain CBS 962.96) TaxID=1314807 RepID=A0A4V4HCL0_DENBC|nr:hypothetical protein K435DRAFT_807251 [Dendrothele bispora CBS 962.96]
MTISMSGSIFFTNASPRTIDDSAIDKVGDWVVHSGAYLLDLNLPGVQVPLLVVLMNEITDLSRKTNSTQDAGQPFSQPTSQSEAAFNSSHDHDANTDNYDEFHRGSGNSGGDPEQYQQTSTGNDQGTKNAYSRSTDGQTTAEDPPSNLANKNWTRNFNGYVTSYRENDNRVVNARAIDNYEYYSKNNQGDDDLENLPASHDDDTHQNAGQPFSSSQPTSQPEADFDGSHDHDTDTNNYDGFQHSSGNSGGDPEQYDQQTSGNDQETKNAYNQNTDSQTPAEDPLSNPINKEHSDGTSRGVWDRRRQSLLKLDVKRIRLRWDDILGEYVPEDDEPKASRDRVTGRYTEQDNRRIGHNAEN